MKILLGAAAAMSALAIAAVPASFALTSGDASTSTDPVTTTSTTPTESPSDEVSESPYDVTSDIPTDAATRGWERDHANNGKHNGWYKNNGHAYGNEVRGWAKCVSTTGKSGCDAKPNKADVSPDASPTPDTTSTTDSTSTSTSGN